MRTIGLCRHTFWPGPETRQNPIAAFERATTGQGSIHFVDLIIIENIFNYLDGESSKVRKYSCRTIPPGPACRWSNSAVWPKCEEGEIKMDSERSPGNFLTRW